MEDFFKTIDQQGGRIPFEIFGNVHLTWLLAIFICNLILIQIYIKLSTHQRNLFRKYFGTLIFFLEYSRRLFLIFMGAFTFEDVPLHLCSIGIVLCFIHAFKPTQLLDDALFMLVIPGAVAALLFPDWNTPIHFNYFYIHSWVIHGLMVAYVSVLLTSGELIPNRKNLLYIFGGLGLFAIPIYAINKLWNTNFLFINTPSPGSPLVFLESIFGNPGYIFGLLALVLMVWTIMYWVDGSLRYFKKSDSM